MSLLSVQIVASNCPLYANPPIQQFITLLENRQCLTAADTQKNENRLARCDRAVFEETNVNPPKRAHRLLLSDVLNLDVSTKLHWLVTHFFAACPQSDCGNNRSKNDSALHGLLS